MTADLAFIVPVYNDWDSLFVLQKEIEASVKGTIIFLIVDDSSLVAHDKDNFTPVQSPTIILHLNNNLGHQRAIATGLAYASVNLQAKNLVVMDGDGEDKAADIPNLLSLSQEFDGIIFAKRTKRNEGPVFTCYYRLYKLMFRMLTG